MGRSAQSVSLLRFYTARVYLKSLSPLPEANSYAGFAFLTFWDRIAARTAVDSQVR